MNLTEKALGRIIYQYRNGAKFKAFISVLPGIVQEYLYEPAQKIPLIIDIDTAAGEQLDICGRIVGIDRPKIASNTLAVFAYNGTPGAQPYNVAPYKGPGAAIPTIPIPDYLYRLVIRAKIIKNTSDATIDDVKRGVEFILGEGFEATVVDLQDMTMRVILNQEPSFNVKALLEIFDLVPRPQGVELEYITSQPNQSISGELGGDALGAVALGGDDS